ncbi:MAG: hydroxyacid dehydrogenase [Pseudomonadota bacterium]
MPDIIITEFMDEAAVDRLRAAHDTHYDPALVDSPEELAKLAADAKVFIVRNRTQVRGALLEAAGKLTCVGRLGVGLDNIDVTACKARDIQVIPATGANDLSVAEYVITTAMALLRNAYAGTDAVIAGDWPRQAMVGRELAGKTMGLIGFGSIAREVAGRALMMGMEVVAFDPHVPSTDPVWQHARNVSLDGVADLADVISLHVPLTEGTRHRVDMKFLTAMKDDAILINAARGGVVDDAALAYALSQGMIGGAALDVFEVEPLTAEAGAKFKGLFNFIATPHIAGVTVESNTRVSALIADKVLAHLEGEGS